MKSKPIPEALTYFTKPLRTRLLLTLQQLEETYITELAEEIGREQANISHIISDFKEQDLIESKKQGRKKILTLSCKGEDLARRLGGQPPSVNVNRRSGKTVIHVE